MLMQSFPKTNILSLTDLDVNQNTKDKHIS